MNNPKSEEFLGIDVGGVKIGIARGNTAARLAEPLKTVEAANSEAAIKNLVMEHAAAGVVVGLPRGLDGNETAQTKAVRDWAQSIKSQIDLPFYWQDEALTSRAAGKLQTSNFKHQTDDEHSLAAAIILQDFLDSPENDRVAV